MNTHKVTFWGTRGSEPTPEKEKMVFGGETSCVSILTAQNELIVLDMGTGFRRLGSKIVNNKDIPNKAHVFLSHYHWDHIQGILGFLPLYHNGYDFTIYGKKGDNESINDIFQHIFNYNFWPIVLDEMKAKISFRDIEVGKYKITDNIQVFTNLHSHPNGAFSYRVEIGNTAIVYVTDVEYHPGKPAQKVIDLAQNADLLIHDAHYSIEDLPSHKGWGHSSWKEAVMVAQTANVKQLVLFHHNPEYNDVKVAELENEAKSEFSNLLSAKQNLTIEIPAS